MFSTRREWNRRRQPNICGFFGLKRFSHCLSGWILEESMMLDLPFRKSMYNGLTTDSSFTPLTIGDTPFSLAASFTGVLLTNQIYLFQINIHRIKVWKRAKQITFGLLAVMVHGCGHSWAYLLMAGLVELLEIVNAGVDLKMRLALEDLPSTHSVFSVNSQFLEPVPGCRVHRYS